MIKKEISGFTMYLDIYDGGISQALNTGGEREKAFMEILQQEVKEGMICVDLGANIGYTTLFICKKAGNNGMVYAIEPDPHNINLLKKNLAANRFTKTEIYQMAISDKDGYSPFYIASKPNLNSMKKDKRTIKEIKVETKTLTTFFQDKGMPNFIKMDVEGHEVEIFKGAYDLFKNNDSKTKILLEVHPQFYSSEHSFAKQLRRFFDIGFKTKYVVSTPIPVPKFFRLKGYKPFKEVETDGRCRGIYNNIKDEDAIELACFEHKEGSSNKIVRSIMIERR